jgi:hypothetical protein
LAASFIIKPGLRYRPLALFGPRIAQVGRIARERAHAAGVPRYYIDESLDPKGRIIRHDPDGTRHVLADCDKDVILDSFLP